MSNKLIPHLAVHKPCTMKTLKSVGFEFESPSEWIGLSLLHDDGSPDDNVYETQQYVATIKDVKTYMYFNESVTELIAVDAVAIDIYDGGRYRMRETPVYDALKKLNLA